MPEKIIQNSGPGNASSPSSSGIQQLQYLYIVAGSVDAFLLRDMALLCNTILAKNRLMRYGQMTLKDISNVSVLVDTIARYLLENSKNL